MENTETFDNMRAHLPRHGSVCQDEPEAFGGHAGGAKKWSNDVAQR